MGQVIQLRPRLRLVEAEDRQTILDLCAMADEAVRRDPLPHLDRSQDRVAVLEQLLEEVMEALHGRLPWRGAAVPRATAGEDTLRLDEVGRLLSNFESEHS